MRKNRYVIFCVLMFAANLFLAQAGTWGKDGLASPDTIGNWIVPAQNQQALPLWGHKDGILLGIAPTHGPRGLIRIFTPYLDLEDGNVMNFIALEPVPKGELERGYSELEMSSLDKGKWGKRFWSSNDSLGIFPRVETLPARGVISEENEEEVLTFYVFSEAFNNGAKVYVKIQLFESRPYEFEMRAYTYGNSVELDNFVLTATMGNKARLRDLILKDKVVSCLDLWSYYKDVHFTPRTPIALEDMIVAKDGRTYFISTPDELDYHQAKYSRGTARHWRYYGKHAIQYWVKENAPLDMIGILTGRYTYWGSKHPIPGGISIENFELFEPFQEGNKYVFGISPENLDVFLKRINK